MTRAPQRAGYSLVEMLAVMWVLTAVLGLGGAMLLTAMRADQVGAATLRELARHNELADQFRTDVANAVEAPDRLGDLTAGPTCLILRAANEHVIYRWQDGNLDRTVRKGDKETHRPVPVGVDTTAVEFARLPGDRALIGIHVIATPAHGTARRTEISAVLGGDTR